ncbi:single-stranded DNA-binding protein [Sphingobium sp. B12D2B]|uniref:single-stranded DNA-binding protein n=1 Tax=Sphingobium sp. B12D2B TaxID=2940577 RepID=UPI002225B633|nr:single-stranded DNA-binding protein [Sphingobium sp. B12D2B]MCW2351735.1 single-strand DNA-binding protein [Sphingobium sp. B12D2B]
MNNINIAGRVVKDPETRGSVITLIVATDRVKLKDGKTYVDEATGYTAKETEFHKVTCFNGLSRSGASRKKGDVVAISGSLHYSSWEDRDGTTRYGCEIWADKIDFF